MTLSIARCASRCAVTLRLMWFTSVELNAVCFCSSGPTIRQTKRASRPFSPPAAGAAAPISQDVLSGVICCSSYGGGGCGNSGSRMSAWSSAVNASL